MEFKIVNPTTRRNIQNPDNLEMAGGNNKRIKVPYSSYHDPAIFGEGIPEKLRQAFPKVYWVTMNAHRLPGYRKLHKGVYNLPID